MTYAFPYDADGQARALPLKQAGWFNASTIAQEHGKALRDWLLKPDTTAYIESMALHQGLTGGPHGLHAELVAPVEDEPDQGIWLHPDLAVAFARWLAPDFAIFGDFPPSPPHFANAEERARWEWQEWPRLLREYERWCEWFRQTFGRGGR